MKIKIGSFAVEFNTEEKKEEYDPRSDFEKEFDWRRARFHEEMSTFFKK